MSDQRPDDQVDVVRGAPVGWRQRIEDLGDRRGEYFRRRAVWASYDLAGDEREPSAREAMEEARAALPSLARWGGWTPWSSKRKDDR